MGLVPSGLQATADRYTYLPAVPLSIAIAFLLSSGDRDGLCSARRLRSGRRSRLKAGVGREHSCRRGAAVVTLAALTWRQTGYWRDSTTLWTRAVEVDSRNDVALYNLGAALSEAGRRDEAIARYEQVLAIVPATRRGAPQPRPPPGGAAGGGRQRPCIATRSRRRDLALRRSGEARSPADARAGRPRHGAHRARAATSRRGRICRPPSTRAPPTPRSRTRSPTRWRRPATRPRRLPSCVPRGSGTRTTRISRGISRTARKGKGIRD